MSEKTIERSRNLSTSALTATAMATASPPKDAERRRAVEVVRPQAESGAAFGSAANQQHFTSIRSALHMAAGCGHEAVVRLLLGEGSGR